MHYRQTNCQICFNPSRLLRKLLMAQHGSQSSLQLSLLRVAQETFNTDFTVVKESPASSHAPFMIIAEPSRKRWKFNTIIPLRKNRRWKTAIETATAVLKEEEVLNSTKLSKWSAMSPEAVAAQKAFLQEMKTVCSAYAENFGNIHKSHELQSRRIWERVFTCYYTILRMVSATRRTVRVATMTCFIIDKEAFGEFA